MRRQARWTMRWRRRQANRAPRGNGGADDALAHFGLRQAGCRKLYTGVRPRPAGLPPRSSPAVRRRRPARGRECERPRWRRGCRAASAAAARASTAGHAATAPDRRRAGPALSDSAMSPVPSAHERRPAAVDPARTEIWMVIGSAMPNAHHDAPTGDRVERGARDEPGEQGQQCQRHVPQARRAAAVDRATSSCRRPGRQPAE